MVTFRIECRDGQIVVPTSVYDKVTVSPDFMDLDSEYEEEESKLCVIDLTGDLYDGSEEFDETVKREAENHNVETQVMEMEEEADEVDVADVADYASEELVQTCRCTWRDIDRCVGELLASLYSGSEQQRTVRILDKESILQLQAKCCAQNQLGNIPLKAGSLRSTSNTCKVHKHRLLGKELRPSLSRYCT